MLYGQKIIHGLQLFLIYLKIMSSSRTQPRQTLNKRSANTSCLFNVCRSHIPEGDIILWNSFCYPFHWFFCPNNYDFFSNLNNVLREYVLITSILRSSLPKMYKYVHILILSQPRSIHICPIYSLTKFRVLFNWKLVGNFLGKIKSILHLREY